MEIAQYIQIGDLTNYEDTPQHTGGSLDIEPTMPASKQSIRLPSFSLDQLDESAFSLPIYLTDEEEDALVKVTVMFIQAITITGLLFIGIDGLLF